MKLGSILGPDVLEILRDDPEALGEGLRDFHPADIADLLYEIPREDRLTVLAHLDPDILGQVLTYLGGGVLRLALTRLPHKMLGKALDTLEPDDGARLLAFLPEEKRLPVLSNMSARDAAEARGLLAYEPGTAGRLMTGKLVKVRPEWSVAETLDHLKKIDPEVATVADLYAVDDKDRLVGVMSLRKLLPAPPARRIGSMMTKDVISVGPDTPDDEVAQLVSKYGFNAIPVIGLERQVLGIVTVDDVVDVLVSRETQAALRMGGVQASEEHKDERSPLDYFGTPIYKIVRTRIGWLLLLFVAATFTGTVLRHFEEELSRVVALSFFIPLIIGTGGNAGSQTVSTIIRALALGEVRMKDTLRVLFRESSTGILLGLLLCGAAMVRALMWHTGWELALVVGLTILAVCAWSNIVAAMVPMLAQKLKIDPTVVSAPMITTVVDGTGLAIYMLIAKAILKL